MYTLGAAPAAAADKAVQPQRHVLVVDDEHDLADQLSHGLSILGFAVVVVYSAADARRELAARGDFVVVVTDVRLAGEEGLALAEEIYRETDELRAKEVVVISGNASTEDAARAARAGASDFLTKPFRLHEIAKAVTVAADRAETRRLQAQGAHKDAAGVSDDAALRKSLLARLEHTNAELAPTIASGAVPPEVAQCVADLSQFLRAPGVWAASSGSGMAEGPYNGLRELADGVARLEELLHAFGPEAPGRQTALELASLATEVMNRVANAHPACAFRIIPPLPAISVLAEPSRLERLLELCLEAALSVPAHPNALRMQLSSFASVDGDWACLTLLAGPDETAQEPPASLLLDGENIALAPSAAALRFFLAQRLASLEGGALSGASVASGNVALRLSLPLQRVQ